MTDLDDSRPLSRIELLVLARLSPRKPPTPSEIAKSLRPLNMPLMGAVKDCVDAALSELTSRAMVEQTRTKSTKGKSRRPPKPKYSLTDRGRFALCSAFELKVAPSWQDMRDHVAPALALGEQPGGPGARAVLKNLQSMTAAWLRRDSALGTPVTISQLCDQVIARALGMPAGAVTPDGIRAYALAMHCGVDGKAELGAIAEQFPRGGGKSVDGGGSLAELSVLARRFAERQLHCRVKKGEAMRRALLRHWASQQDAADDAQRPRQPWSVPLLPTPSTALQARYSSEASAKPDPGMLLMAVRDAIPRVGADGRYGKENVFVSALWRQIAGDRRIADLSLEGFKRWLIAANRERWLALVRADLVDDMDSRLVEDSEIEDLGATFHFVLDRRDASAAQRQVHHA